MTDTEPEPDAPAFDPLAVLTIAELDAGSRQLGTSLVRQVIDRGDRYEDALTVVLWLHRRRADRTTEPRQLLRELRELTFPELSDHLGRLEGVEDGGDADPLVSGSGSRSRASGAAPRRSSATAPGPSTSP